MQHTRLLESCSLGTDRKDVMEVRTLTEGWAQALQRGVADVCALYASGATLHPTYMDRFITDASGVREYFEFFVPQRPVVHILKSSQSRLADNAILHTGTYKIELGPCNCRDLVHARFTFVWQLLSAEWQITHHHSSESP